MSQVQILNSDHCIWRARINHLCKSGLDSIDCKSSLILDCIYSGNYGLFPANYVDIIDNKELQVMWIEHITFIHSFLLNMSRKSYHFMFYLYTMVNIFMRVFNSSFCYISYTIYVNKGAFINNHHSSWTM